MDTSDGVERLEYDDLPRGQLLTAMREWLRFHGLDPADVCIPGWIERDSDRGAVRALTFVRDSFGDICWALDGKGGGDAVLQVTVSRSEGPPLPFPPGAASAMVDG